MVEEGQEWKDHVLSRRHRRMRRERERPKALHRSKKEAALTGHFDFENDLDLNFTCLFET